MSSMLQTWQKAMRTLLLILLSLFFVYGDIMPISFHAGENINILMSKIRSSKTLLSFDYYMAPFCRPQQIFHQSQNIGQILSGDRISNSFYEVII
jgi:hypothetical protein